MKQHWAILSRGEGVAEHEDLYTILIEYGIKPAEFVIYSTVRSFLASQGISDSHPVAFHAGRIVGTKEAVLKYLQVGR
jgi:hypothetical protein